MYNKRGQAAMEFLMTYGWAILAVIVVIGVLVSFGVFSPDKLTPTQTIVNEPFFAEAASVSATQVQVDLRNGAGEDVTVTSFTTTIAGCAGGALVAPIVIASGTTGIIATPVGTCTLTTGKIVKGDLTISYRKGGSTLVQSSTGTLREKVQ